MLLLYSDSVSYGGAETITQDGQIRRNHGCYRTHGSKHFLGRKIDRVDIRQGMPYLPCSATRKEISKSECAEIDTQDNLPLRPRLHWASTLVV